MALDTYQDVWNRVLLRCPSLDPNFSKDLVRNAFRRLYDRRRWSWKVKYGQFISPDAYNTGTVSVTQNSTLVTGSGTVWTSDLIGRQFRVGLNAPIYTVAIFNSATSIELDSPYGAPTQSPVTYEIYQCFYPVPSDFHQFVDVWDPAFNWRLQLNIMQQEINIWDAQRASTGNVYVVSFRDYTTSQVGIVAPVLQVLGSGSSPTSSGTYTAPVSALFTVEITTGGVAGVAQYRWKKGSAAYTSGVLTNGAGTPQSLLDGVQIAFPVGPAYTLGNIWVIQATAISNPGLPRYELWPHAKTNHVYPFLYEVVPPDLSDPNATIPRYIAQRGDVLMEMALHEVAKWPGVVDKPNPYYSITLANRHEQRAEQMLNELELRDDEIWEQDLQYHYPMLSWAMATPLGDSRWLQSHAI